MSPLPFANARSRGFTLIELLVVISMVALLIAILLPALAAARESGRSVACLSNQRQIGLSVAMYQNDADDYFPPLQNLTTGAFWPGILWQSRHMPDPQAYVCPSATGISTRFLDEPRPVNASDTDWRNVHYGANREHIYANRLPATYPKRAATDEASVRITDVIDAEETISIVDTRHSSDGFAFYYTPSRPAFIGPPPTQPIPDARHGNGTSLNVLWTDGHASAVRISDRANPWDNGLTNWQTDKTGNWWDVYPTN